MCKHAANLANFNGHCPLAGAKGASHTPLRVKRVPNTIKRITPLSNVDKDMVLVHV
jgi:hypothetical protein